MAIKGLSIPVFGKYNYNSATQAVTYNDGIINPKAVSYSIEVESAEDNPLYADNQVAENDIGRFNTGTYTLETDDLVQSITEYLTGAKIVQKTYGNGKTASVLVFDDDQKPQALGVGIIEEHQINNVTQYKAVITLRTTFTIPSDAATTRGETIEWQTRSITGTIARSESVGDDGNHPWKHEAWFTTEGDALEYIKWVLGVAGVLTVTSVAGDTAGQTEVTVTPEKMTNGTYYYEVGEELELPGGNNPVPSTMTQWDGTSEITATNGQQILIVEAVDGLIKNAGITTAIVGA